MTAVMMPSLLMIELAFAACLLSSALT